MEWGPLDQAWDPDVTHKLLLENLRCFILEDATRECLKLLSPIIFPPECDFHWTVIEPFGTLGYSEGDLDVHLHFLRHIFDFKTEGASIPSVAALEIITDFDGYHHGRTRGLREWPEEMRVTFADSVPSAMSQFVLRPGLEGPVPYRDLTRDDSQPKRSFAVRSQMLSTQPSYLENRYRPFDYSNAANPIWIDVPLFDAVMRTFITKMKTLKSFEHVSTLAVPRHAHRPHDHSGWTTFLSNLDITRLLLPGITNTGQLEALADHLATRRPHPRLASVWLPDIASGEDLLSDDEIRDFMDPLLGNRRGCEQIAWSAEKFS
ncbi:hypothetical protein PENSPDRAFT_695705 [Peniophora sp. CONT]|nr:hypothetical protein PENSPDRAFT_695705 [Peniophora sp. CONT]